MQATEAKKFVGKIIRVNRLHRSLIDRYTRDAQLHRSQNHMLIYIMKCETPPSQKELAATFEVTPAAIAMTMKKMEQKGLIQRVAAEGDSRVNLVTVSEKGREIMERNRALFESTDAAMLDGVTVEELEAVSKVLDKFIDNLIKIGAEDVVPTFCRKK